MPKRLFEKPITFDDLFERAQEWDGGFTVHTPDSVPTSFIDELLDEHFPDRDKTEYLGPEITDEDIYRDLLAGVYVTSHDKGPILEHRPPMQQHPKNDMTETRAAFTPPSEPTSFISIPGAFIGVSDIEPEDRVLAIVPVPTVEETPS